MKKQLTKKDIYNERVW